MRVRMGSASHLMVGKRPPTPIPSPQGGGGAKNANRRTHGIFARPAPTFHPAPPLPLVGRGWGWGAGVAEPGISRNTLSKAQRESRTPTAHSLSPSSMPLQQQPDPRHHSRTQGQRLRAASPEPAVTAPRHPSRTPWGESRTPHVHSLSPSSAPLHQQPDPHYHSHTHGVGLWAASPEPAVAPPRHPSPTQGGESRAPTAHPLSPSAAPLHQQPDPRVPFSQWRAHEDGTPPTRGFRFTLPALAHTWAGGSLGATPVRLRTCHPSERPAGPAPTLPRWTGTAGRARRSRGFSHPPVPLQHGGKCRKAPPPTLHSPAVPQGRTA